MTAAVNAGSAEELDDADIDESQPTNEREQVAHDNESAAARHAPNASVHQYLSRLINRLPTTDKNGLLVESATGESIAILIDGAAPYHVIPSGRERAVEILPNHDVQPTVQQKCTRCT